MMAHAKQLELEVRAPGTRAPRAGRPKKKWPQGVKAPASHGKREPFVKGRALHVTLRTLPVARNLRRMNAYQAVRIGARVVLARSGFRLVQFSIQSNHIHLIVEADSRAALSNGVRAFVPALWLTREGWKRGGEVSVFTVPG